MACEFYIPFSGDAEVVLARAKKTVEGQGGQFTGDTESGDFDVAIFGNKIVGNYIINGTTLNISITDKPFLIPCSTIEGYLKNQLS